MKKPLAATSGFVTHGDYANEHRNPDEETQMQNEPNIVRPAAPIANLDAALAHVAQSKLLLRRAAAGSSDEREVRSLHDLSSVLQFALEEIVSIVRARRGRTPSVPALERGR